MKSIKLFILSVLATISATAQQVTFEYNLHLENKNVACYNIIETKNDEVFFVGKYGNLNSNNSGGIIIKLNSYGQLVDSLNISIDNRALRFTQIVEDTDNTLIVNGISSDTTLEKYNGSIELFRFDTQLNNLQKNSIHVSDFHNISSYMNSLDSNDFVISGSRFMGTVPPPDTRFNYRINSNLDSVYSFQGQNAATGCFYTKQINDTTFWMLISLKRSILTDTLFRSTGEMGFLPYDITEDYWIKWDSDSSFYLIGDFINDDGNHEIGLLRMLHPMDTTGHIFKTISAEDTISFPAPFGVDFKCKDSVFFGGTKNFWVFPDNTPSYYVLRQTDSLLNTRWERFYGGDANYTLWSVFATKDGGCLMGGIRHDFSYPDGQTDAYVLKVNSQGIVTHTLENPGIEMHEAIVFPNPGRSCINIRVAAQYAECTFRLYDINGVLIMEKELKGSLSEIDATFLKPATYIYKVFNTKGLSETGKWVKR